MKISIITITYNSQETIKKTIESVLSQSYSNIEYIIVDGKSTDKTIHIIKTYYNRISKFISEKDEGLYFALNKGIRIASGDVIGFLHSDDFFEDNNVISNIVNVFNKSKSDGVYGNLFYVNKNNKVIRKWVSNSFKMNSLKFGWMPPHPTIFLKSNIYKKYGCFNTTYRISADYEFILRIFKEKNLKLTYLPIFITRMTLGGVSSSFKNLLSKLVEDYNIIKSHNLLSFLTLICKNLSKVKQFL
jgi:glycosyltransferase involved in cell wall biosynthesis